MAWRAWLQRVWWRPALGAAALALLPLNGVYHLLRSLHALPWALGWRQPGRVPVPVVVVGNLIVGGAGKTPTTLALVEGLRSRGWTPGIVSRGYGGTRAAPGPVHDDTPAASCGDEPLLLWRRARVPVWTGRDRVVAAQALCAAHPAVDILVSDDGLQHRPLPRAAQVIVFDERGAGNGWCLPAGPLRQPLAETVPDRSVVVYNAAGPSVRWPGHLAVRRFGGLRTLGDWWAGRDDGSAAHLTARPLVAAAGIAAPERFFALLEQQGLSFERLPLPDHAALEPAPWPADGRTVVVTEKDAVKLPADHADAGRIVVAALDFALPDAFWDALLPLLPARRPPR
jgi:tetraacyldisaccharide 4'-kinase